MSKANKRKQYADQFRYALQKFAATLGEDEAMEIASVYPKWESGKAYAAGQYVTYGTNGVGDPQLYKMAQAHTSQADWPPDKTAALYVPIGLNASGYPVWSQPTGAHDAYNTGDVVDHGGVLYESAINGNTTVPGSDERYWKVYKA